MKYKILIYTLFVGILSACNPDEFLDVYPTGSTIPTTVEDFDKLLENPDVAADETARNLTFMDPDVSLPNAFYDGYNSVIQFQYVWDAQPYNDVSYTDSDWNDRYSKIMTFNTILQDVDGADLGNRLETDRARVKGEALAQRAYELFSLVTEYGAAYSANNTDAPGIPMPLEVDLTAQLSRKSVGEVYAQIEKDLDAAENLLQNNNPINTGANFRPGMASIYGLQALVALTKGDFGKANTYADRALNLYHFLYDYTGITNNTEGNAWSGLPITNLDYSTTTENVVWNREHRDDYQVINVFYGEPLLQLFDQENDQRFILFHSTESYTGVSVSPSIVYASYRRTVQAGLTTPDLYLISAEAKVRTGDRAGALSRLNTLLENRILNFTPYTADSFSDDAAVLELVKAERRKEFMASGKNFLDQKRYVAYGDNVPTFERNVNGNIFTLEPDQESYMVPISLNIQSLNPNLN
ncbi:RagB/SusD family nutrient uptake outer membrane protein [Formosa sp. S-31]|uniref:RagB/SusD family nutrient uptake outer membrane protein n=1 Tax=Formosa sp. S-31 TaxID=2790949 RepID=UPI003EB77D89